MVAQLHHDPVIGLAIEGSQLGGAGLDNVCPSQLCFLFRVGKTCVSMYDTTREYKMAFYKLGLNLSGFGS